MTATSPDIDPAVRTPAHPRILHTHHTIFVCRSEWATPRLTGEERARLIRRLRARDACILVTLSQHRYLTTDQLQALFFPSARTAQRRLGWLVEQRLLMHWDQQETAEYGWHRRPSMFTLSRRGAWVTGAVLHTDPRPFVKRSQQAVEAEMFFTHALEINGFFVALAAAARERPDQGLYQWIGQDTLRQGYEERRLGPLIPDGRGRYVLPGGEIRFFLEWDRATEQLRKLATKAQSYLRQYGGAPGPGFDHVLFVVPNTPREARVRTTLVNAARGTRTSRGIRFWTTTAEALSERGPLGQVWKPVDGEERIAFTGLDPRPSQGDRPEHSIGKFRWWNVRLGGGESG